MLMSKVQKIAYFSGMEMISMEAATSFLEAKLRVPSLPPGLVYRQQYLQIIELICSSRLTAVIAPAGFGKTTLLTAFANTPIEFSALPEKCQRPLVSWYSLDQLDNNAFIFLNYLIRAFSISIAGFGVECRKVLQSVPDAEKQAGIVVAALLEEIWRVQNLAQELVLIFDDYHLVAGSKVINESVETLLYKLPPNIHVVVAARHPLPMRTERLALQTKVSNIDFTDLSFAREDIKELLRKVGNYEPEEELVEEIALFTEGWPAGVTLMGHSLLQAQPARHTLSQAKRGREAVFRYFADEIFTLQDEEMRRFIICASLLKHLTAAACRDVFGYEKAAQLLQEAVSKGLFLNQVEIEGERVYRFHQLFQAFLGSLYSEYFDQEALCGLRKRAGVYYEELGLLDEAIAYYVEGKLYQLVTDLLERRGMKLIELGYVDQLRRWLSLLPSEVVENNPHLLYYKGFAYQNSDPAQAVNCLERAANALKDSDEVGLQVRALIYMATIYSLQNRVDKVQATSAQIPTLKALRKDPWSRGVLLVASLCQSTWEDNLKRGVWLGRLARYFPLDPDWQWALLSYSCMIYYRQGDLEIARRLIEEAKDLPIVKNNDNWLGLAHVLHHVTLYSLEDEEMGQKIREELWNLGEKYNSPYFKAYAERSRAFPYYQRGYFAEARKLFLSSLYFFEKAGNNAMASITRLDLALLESSLGYAVSVLPEAKQALQQIKALNCGQGLEDFGESILGAIAREAGEYELAQQHLLHAAKQSKRKGAKQILAGTYLQLAQLYTLL